jgi:DNA-binding GntR family transcriptional regulator
MSVEPAIVRRTLHDELVGLLRNMIIEGELRPGSRIAELRLCSRFGVSRTPLREALKVLSAEGLVRLLPNKGATVVRVTHREVDDAVPVLATLEALAGELACERIDKERLEQIKNVHGQMVEHFRRGERQPYHELNRVLHDAIFEAADNKTLSETHNMLYARLNSLLVISPKSPRQWAAAVDDHEQMLAALEAGNGAQFAQISRGHGRRRAEVLHVALDMLEARAA